MKEEKLEDTTIQGLFMRASHTYFQKNFCQINRLGLHPGQIPVLWHLFQEEGLSQKELSNRLKVKPPTVNVSLQRLEKMECIYRQQDAKDLRISRIYLTEKGKDLAEQIERIMENNERQMTKNFTETEICLLSRFLRQMIENIESMETIELQEGD